MPDHWKDLFSVPEAEKLSDIEYRRLVLRAKGQRGDAAWMIPAGWALGAVLLWVLFVKAVSAVLAGALGMAWTGPTPVLGVPSPPATPMQIAWRAGTVVAGVAIFMAVYHGVAWALLVRTMRTLANRAGCPFCRFSLVGLKIEDGAVTCPECGGRVVLAEHNLFPDDLTPPRELRKALPGAGPMGAYKGGSKARTR